MIPPWANLTGGAAIAAIGFGSGWQAREWRCEAAEAKRLKALIVADDRARTKADARAADYEADRAAIQQQAATSRTIIREVYLNVEAPADCETPADALRVLDDAIGASGHSREPAPAMPSG